MGTHEISILPNVNILIDHDFEIPQKIFLYYFCFKFWNFSGHISNSTFLLYLYFFSWYEYFYLGYQYLYFEYRYRFLAFLQTHTVLSAGTLFTFTMYFGVYPFCLLFDIYLPSSQYYYFSRSNNTKKLKKTLGTVNKLNEQVAKNVFPSAKKISFNYL